MKKMLMLVVIVSIMFGCAAQKPLLYVDRVESSQGIDFTEYSEKGFLITPEKYLSDYESVGLLSFSISAEAKLENLLIPGMIEGHAHFQRYEWKIEKINYKDVLEFAYKTSIEMGGDAITNFDIDIDFVHFNNSEGYPDVDIPWFNITGFVIKRK